VTRDQVYEAVGFAALCVAGAVFIMTFPAVVAFVAVALGIPLQ